MRCKTSRNEEEKKIRTNDVDGGANGFGEWHIKLHKWLCVPKEIGRENETIILN